MPTLLQINTVVNSGSTGRIAEEIGLTVINNGWQSYIAYGRNERPSSSKLIKIGNSQDIKLHGLLTRLFDKHGYGSKNATVELINKIREVMPDIIHLHNIHGYYLNVNVLFDYLAEVNIPVVWTLHDCWAITGHCSYFDFVSCNKWKTICFDCPQTKKYPSSFFYDNSKNNHLNKKAKFTSLKNLTIVPVSNWLGNIIRNSFLSDYPIRRIYNGVNLDVFCPQEEASIDRLTGCSLKFTILGVASIWDARKGLSDFVKLASLLTKGETIVLVGLTNKQIRNLPSNVIGIERTENVDQLAQLYSAADVYLNPTWEDNFPTTNLEALACGTPVITYNTGGSIESVSPETGFIVEQGDLNGVLNAINTIKERGKSHYTKACRERAVKLYNKDDRYNEYLELYNELLKKK